MNVTFPFTSYRDEVLHWHCMARGMRTRPMQVFIYTGPNHFAFRQNISYENGKTISAKETSAHGLQKLLNDPAPPGCGNVHNT